MSIAWIKHVLCIIFSSGAITHAELNSISEGLISPGIRRGLVADGDVFHLDGQPLKIYSGTIHYFRVPPEYWRDRLEKLKACGLNTVSTEVPWNLHEETPGKFTFSGQLDLARYLQIAKDLGLHVILRPGPYICAEWEFGGYPAWLLQVPDMIVRSHVHPRYTDAVNRYMRALFVVIGTYQHASGGPIIAMQLENEYGSYGSDKNYLQWLANTLRSNGLTEMMFTADGAGLLLAKGSLPGLYTTVNGQQDIVGAISQLYQFQPGRPLMVTELWTGWFDHWTERHHGWPAESYRIELGNILRVGASVNLYTFHGGTNFGFMNGANRENRGAEGMKYQPTITSYDYDCLLDEAGRPTAKYYITQQLLREFANVNIQPMFLTLPQLAPKSYGTFPILRYALLTDVLNSMFAAKIPELDFMENICYSKSFNSEFCITQNFGFVAYRKNVADISVRSRTSFEQQRLRFSGIIADRALLIIDGRTIILLEKNTEGQGWDQEIILNSSPSDIVLLVENMGRVNYATNGDDLNSFMRRGAKGQMFLNSQQLADWSVYPLDMKPPLLQDLGERYAVWRPLTEDTFIAQPAFFQADAVLNKPIQDSFINMQLWAKGNVFINKFNLGRYWNVGPQQTLYVPAPRLQDGINEIIIFELHAPSRTVTFQDQHILG